MKIAISNDNCIAPDWTEQQQWTPVTLEAGDLLVFGSYLAHRSGKNHSSKDRKALYATYNKASDGDHHGRSARHLEPFMYLLLFFGSSNCSEM